MDASTFITDCPKCRYDNDPAFRFCIKCGTMLPGERGTYGSKTRTGINRGIEPSKSELNEEPVYDPSGSSERTRFLYVKDEGTIDADVIASMQNPSGCTVLFFLILSIAMPHVGIFMSILWFMKPRFRKAVPSLLIASAVGFILWALYYYVGF